MKKLKEITSLALAIIMMISISASLSITAKAAKSSYSSNYKQWSQGKSAYSSMKKYGCWVVAQAKLIRETGINTSSSFNPDTYYNWEKKSGCINSKMYQTSKGGVNAPVLYAKSLGNNNLKYLGKTTKNCISKIKSNAKNGYYSIIKVKNTEHYFMADNKTTKAKGKIYIYDSWDSSNNPPYPMSIDYKSSGWNPKYSSRIVEVYTYSYSKTTKSTTTTVNKTTTKITTTKTTTAKSVTAPSVSVKAVSNLGTKSAQVNFTANNPSKVTIKTIGVEVRKKGASNWVSKSEAMNVNYVNASSTPMWWTIGSGKELNTTLSPATTYEYRAYVVYNGTKYYSSTSTFTTKADVSISNSGVSVTSTTATIKFSTSHTSGTSVTNAGIRIKKASASSWEKTYKETVALKYRAMNPLPTTYVIGSGKEINFTLSKNTKYIYQPYVIVNGITYYGSQVTFTTKK